MRKLVPLLATATLLAGLPATAAQADAETTTPAPPSTSVTLPTGDRVDDVGGAVAFRPGPGRENVGYFSDHEPGGGLSILPADVAGNADARDYDVSALVGAAPAAEPRRSTATGTSVTVTLRNRHGKAPDTATVYYGDENGDGDAFPIGPDGTGTLEIPPGEYHLLVRMLNRPTEGARGEFVGVARDFTVGTESLALTVDGAGAAPLGAETDRPVLATLTEVRFGWNGPFFVGASMASDTDMFLTPSDEAGVTVETKYTLVNPDGPKAADPYTYRLLYQDDGIPADFVHRARTRDLAAVKVDYGTLGVPWDDADECATSNRGDEQNGMCALVPVVVPSTRTNYYIADGRTRYQSSLSLLDPDTGTVGGYSVDDERTYTPGRQRLRVGTGPVSLGAGPEDMYRYGDVLYFTPRVLNNDQGSGAGYYGDISPLTGSAVVTRDGAEINRVEGDLTWFDTGLEPGAAGRYRLALDATLTAPWTDLATRTKLDWEFDTAPGEPGTYTPLPFGVVDLAAEGVVNGEAKRGRAQDVVLTYATQSGAPEAEATSMTFEVSYDDGATWKKVAIDRDGDHATATLCHPRGAAYLSVRMTATDTAGAKVSHTTIRSYALV